MQVSTPIVYRIASDFMPRTPSTCIYTLQRHILRRSITSTTRRREQQEIKTSPFSGYSIDALDAPLLSITQQNPSKAPVSRAPVSSQEETAAKARLVFSSRLDGPAERAARQKEIANASTLIAGILVPPKPEEPDNCCMSGCVNCVWDLYGEEVEEWAAKSTEARLAREKEKGVADVMSSMDDDGGGSETSWDPLQAVAPTVRKEKEEDLFKDIPVGIREFMKTEKKLRTKLQQKKEKDGTAGSVLG